MKRASIATLVAAILLTAGASDIRAQDVGTVDGAGWWWNTANYINIRYQQFRRSDYCLSTPFRWNGHPVQWGGSC